MTAVLCTSYKPSRIASKQSSFFWASCWLCAPKNNHQHVQKLLWLVDVSLRLAQYGRESQPQMASFTPTMMLLICNTCCCGMFMAPLFTLHHCLHAAGVANSSGWACFMLSICMSFIAMLCLQTSVNLSFTQAVTATPNKLLSVMHVACSRSIPRTDLEQ